MSSGCSKRKPLKKKKNVDRSHPEVSRIPILVFPCPISLLPSHRKARGKGSYGWYPTVLSLGNGEGKGKGREMILESHDPLPPPTLPSGSLRFLSSLPLLFLIETKGKETSDGNRIFSYGTRNESMGETVRGDVRTDAKSSKRRSVRRTNAQDERTFGTIAGRKENKI